MKYFILFCLIGIAYCQKSKVCVYPSQQGLCDDLSKGDSMVQCIKVQDSVECAMQIKSGQIHFGTFFPEQAHLVSNFINEDTAVIGEVREENAKTNSHSFQTVVVVKKNYNSGLTGLKGTKYCHPGFDFDEAMSLRAKKEFENAILKNNADCSADKTVIENDIQQLSNLFTSACRPGYWAEDIALDQKLKKKYSNLCALCDKPETCEYYNNDDPNQMALKCLIEKNADIAYTTVAAVESFFSDGQRNKNDYKLLSRDGETKDITSENYDSCSWRNQPWTIIIGNSNKVQELQIKLLDWIDAKYIINGQPFGGPRKIPTNWQTSLKNILGPDEQSRFWISKNAITLQQHLESNKQSLRNDQSTTCTMNWCTVSEEENLKCKWLAKAGSNLGIEPKMACVMGTDVPNCLNKIKNKEADVMTIDSHFGFLARKNTLRTLLYAEEKPDDVSKIVAVIKDSSDITKLSDLKTKKACFPEYRGIAWLAFIQNAREAKAIPDNCDYGKSISGFFDEVCAPGVEDSFHMRSQGADTMKLCSLCKNKDSGNSYCGADDQNEYYGNEGSFACIKNEGDVAFIEMQAIASEDTHDIRVLCKDNSIKQFEEVTDDCALAAIVNSEIVSKSDNKGNKDYKEALLAMDTFFGTSSKKYNTMDMFKKFQDQDDLMFKTKTILITDEKSSNQYVQNYKKLFESVDKCTDGAGSLTVSFVLILASYILNVCFF